MNTKKMLKDTLETFLGLTMKNILNFNVHTLHMSQKSYFQETLLNMEKQTKLIHITKNNKKKD